MIQCKVVKQENLIKKDIQSTHKNVYSKQNSDTKWKINVNTTINPV